MDLRLSMCLGDYDINRALLTGEVKPKGIELTGFTDTSPHRHWRMARHHEFDVCEFSMAKVTMLGENAIDDIGLAIPAFPHRRFRHGFIYVRTDDPISDPVELNGKRIGLRTWQNTAGMFVRGMLQDFYGLDLSTVTWVPQDEEDIKLPDQVTERLHRVPEGRDVFEMLVAGELDAVIYPEPLDVRPGQVSPVRTLFRDPKAAEIEFFQRTGFFPIMHTVVIKQATLDRHPWIAVNLLEAFRQSKDRAFGKMRNPRSVSLAWFEQARQEQIDVLGPDPWSYKFWENKAQLETLMRWSVEQGLSPAIRPVQDMFVPSTLDDAPEFVGI